MKRSSRISVLVVVALLLALAISVSVQAQGGSRIPRNAQPLPQPVVVTPDDVVSQTVSEAEQAEALRYWTAAAKAASIPLIMEATGDVLPLIDPAAAEMNLGVPGFSPAQAAAPDAEANARAAYPLDWAIQADTLDADADMFLGDDPFSIAGSSQVYDFYNANKPSALWQMVPHRWVGLLTFKDGSNYYRCSATSIGNNKIVTAAHCAFNTSTNQWTTNRAISPGYRNGSSPYGTFAVSGCVVKTAWVNYSGNYALTWAANDVAVCSTGNNSAGRSLTYMVGAAGKQWNYGYTRHFNMMGYPGANYAGNSFTDAGKYLFGCAAESFTYTTDVRGAGCYMGGGSSGGPWFAGYKPFVTAAVDGVNSGGNRAYQNMYGPRFTDVNFVQLCTSAGGC